MKSKAILILCLAFIAFRDSFVTAQKATPTVSIDSLKKAVDALDHDLGWLKNLKVNGWIQAQYQLAESKAAKTYDGGDFLANSNNRFMVRRGRIKVTYTNKLSQYVLQINATERGLNVVDFYAKITDPWTKTLSLTVGVMNRPFGFEIQQSSADRETPERARFTQILLPNERDLGAMATFQPTKGQKLFGLKVDAGWYNGTGIAVPGTTSLNGAGVVDFDSFKDFIGRAHYKKSWKEERYTLGAGASHYNGGFVYQNNVVYTAIETNSAGYMQWKVADTIDGTRFKKKKAPRIYYGADLQFAFKSLLGTTTLRCEYITGKQAGIVDESKSPSSLPAKQDAYIRNFRGMYTYFIQRIGKTKHEIALKYEWYDPNSKISSSDITAANVSFTKADVKYTALGIGYNYYIHENVKLMLYYNRVTNETTPGITGFASDLKDDVLTIRMQYRF